MLEKCKCCIKLIKFILTTNRLSMQLDFMMDNLSHPIVDDPEFFEQRPLSTLTKISADLILGTH